MGFPINPTAQAGADSAGRHGETHPRGLQPVDRDELLGAVVDLKTAYASCDSEPHGIAHEILRQALERLRAVLPGNPNLADGVPTTTARGLLELCDDLEWRLAAAVSAGVAYPFDGRRLAQLRRIAAELMPEPTPEPVADVGEPTAAADDAGGNGESLPETKAQAKLPRKPVRRAWLAFYVREYLNVTKKTAIAETMVEQGETATQGQVTKWLKAVDAYLEAGGIPPTVQELRAQPAAMDPAVLDMGARQNGLTPRQRNRPDPADDWD